MMEAANTSEPSVNFYQTTRRNIPEDSHLHTRCRTWNLTMFGQPWWWKQALQWNVASQKKTMETKFRVERKMCRRVTFEHHLYLPVSPSCWRSSRSNMRSRFYGTRLCHHHCIPLGENPTFSVCVCVINLSLRSTRIWGFDDRQNWLSTRLTTYNSNFVDVK
jgi:hypothetical protein